MRILLLAAALALPSQALAQAALPKEPAKPAAQSGPVATVNGVAIPRSRADFLARQQTQRGAPDSEQLRAAVRDELVNREIIVQEAARSGLSKKADVQAQIELARQEVIVGVFINEYLRTHPVTNAEIQKEYDRAKAEVGDKEYKARHILVDKEDGAKDLIAELKKGGKFDELAKKNSTDQGTKEHGGELDWSVPAAFDKQFSDALAKLEKGKITETPVRTRYGFHVIQLDDVRPVKFPALAEVKPQVEQRLKQQKMQDLVRDLRAKAKVE